MKKLAVNTCRLVLAAVFVFSGFVKAVDPLGTQYKITDYLEAMGLGRVLPDIATLAMAIGLAALEFCLGIFMLFAIRRRLTSRVVLVLMAAMTVLTLWLAVANPVSDCGCFGDAVKLTNWQTLWKNVVLLAAAVVVVWRPMEMFRFVSRSNQWIVINYSVLFALAVALWSLYDLPPLDFRPYHVGADIRQGMEVPEGAPQPQFETTFILEKDGHRQEFSLDDYPDSTWAFVDARTVMVSEGYQPPIHDFSLTLLDDDGDAVDDITQQVLADTGYTFLLVSPHIEQADESRLDLINELYEYSREHGYHFYGVTASTQTGISQWRDMTGAEYPFCQADETTLKTVIRSNPGIVLLHGGVVVRKWSHNRLPGEEELALPLEQSTLGQVDDTPMMATVLRLMLWFALPLLLLVVADRTWMWTKWLRRRRVPSPQ